MRTPHYRTWLFGLTTSLLIACGVEAPPSTADPQTETQASALSATADSLAAPAASPLVLHPIGSACTPGAYDSCCPFPKGCSCLGDQFCSAAGTWGACEGAGMAGHLCP